jgi:hypothetical protein
MKNFENFGLLSLYSIRRQWHLHLIICVALQKRAVGRTSNNKADSFLLLFFNIMVHSTVPTVCGKNLLCIVVVLVDRNGEEAGSSEP